MGITIYGLSERALERLQNECGARIFYGDPFERGDVYGVYDVVINESAIIKICVDMIVLDLGGRKSYIANNEFFTMTVG